jgi:hypothetical protein
MSLGVVRVYVDGSCIAMHAHPDADLAFNPATTVTSVGNIRTPPLEHGTLHLVKKILRLVVQEQLDMHMHAWGGSKIASRT